MNWIGIFLLVIHIAACTALILIVLLQAGKGASLGASFGGGSGQTVFGARSATFMTKVTWVLAASFMLTSLLLTMISPWGGGRVESGAGILHEEPIAAPPLGEEAATGLPGAGLPPEHVFEGLPRPQEADATLAPALPDEVPAQAEEQ